MASMEKRIRKRLEAAAASDAVSGPVARLVAGHIDRLHRRTDWEYDGREAVIDAVSGGKPIIFALWHGRLAMSARGWDPAWSPFCVVTSAQIPGRLVGRVMRRFDLDTMPMKIKRSNTASVLQVARMVRGGTTIGFAIDGPEGPKRVAKPIPIDWARLTGAPIWLYTNSVERYRTLPSWDDMLLPRPGGRGVMMYRKWDAEVPKKLDPQAREALRLKLQQDLDALTLEADQRMGHDGLIA
ncbi:lysophospholipid acyltransferase family protein [Tropicimonas sp. IMCC6043]|uniref:lysophospholipid acyltransferase family protein n=1 Tax=Tropicimonas sp. IMCC6043 TaxID=2510645 RepID=UPI00101D0283|nr:DUF374 domain-containing protein [Tropicimonas sp. IMCC6043]RYH10560.1 DUF374 domain-containing protein [Tropicimonas sp. IMCC6043]